MSLKQIKMLFIYCYLFVFIYLVSIINNNKIVLYEFTDY